MAAPEDPRGLGLPRSSGDDHGATIHIALPREALQLWLSGVRESGGSGRTLEATEAGRDWRAAYRRLHDGPRGKRERTGISSSGLRVLLRRRFRRKLSVDQANLIRHCNLERSRDPSVPYGSNPNTVNEAWPPTYTLPFATVGTVNFTAAPEAPEPVEGLLKSRFATLEAS